MKNEQEISGKKHPLCMQDKNQIQLREITKKSQKSQSGSNWKEVPVTIMDNVLLKLSCNACVMPDKRCCQTASV